MADFTGTEGDDSQAGSAAGDIFDYSQGGHDTLDGGDGNDEFDFGAAFDLGDSVNGGPGFDTLVLDGDYALAFTATSFTSIEALKLTGATHQYHLTLTAANVSSELNIELEGGSSFVDGSAVSGGSLEFQDYTAGADTMIGGAANDGFNLYFAPARGSQIDGGGGFDVVSVMVATVGFHATSHSLRNIEVVSLFAAAEMWFSDGNVAADATLKVFANGAPGDAVALDAHKEQDGHYLMRGGDAADQLTGGRQADTLRGGAGDDVLSGGEEGDRLHGGGGHDIYAYRAVADSRAGAADLINGLAPNDRIDLSLFDADSTQDGQQHFTLVGAFTGQAGELALVYDAAGDVTRIMGDVNGDARADLVIKVMGDHHDFTGFVLA